MDTPLHLIVRGTPVSCQSNRRFVREWKEFVANVARQKVNTPCAHLDFAITITHFYLEQPRCDADNISKPICDALNQIVYRDDRQIVERTARQIPILRAFTLDGLPRELAIALWEAKEFVHIHVFRVVPRTMPIMRPRRTLCMSA